jgi:hypothetical protein
VLPQPQTGQPDHQVQFTCPAVARPAKFPSHSITIHVLDLEGKLDELPYDDGWRFHDVAADVPRTTWASTTYAGPVTEAEHRANAGLFPRSYYETPRDPNDDALARAVAWHESRDWRTQPPPPLWPETAEPAEPEPPMVTIYPPIDESEESDGAPD